MPGQEADARQILRDAEAAGDQAAIAGALAALGLALGIEGRFAEAEDALLRGVELAPSPDRSVVETHTNALLALHDALRGHMSAASARLSQAYETESGTDAIVWESGALIALLRGELAVVLAQLRQAERDQPRLSSPWIVLFGVIADAEHGRLAQARSGLDRLRREYQGDDSDLFSQARRWGEGIVAWSEGRLTAAVAMLQRVVDRYSAMGAFGVLGFVLADLAEVAANAGDSPAAMRAASSAEDVLHRVGGPSQQALHQLAASWSLLAVGRSDEAAAAARRAANGLRAVGFPLLEARARVAYAQATRTSNQKLAIEAMVDAVGTFERCGAALRAGRARTLLTDLRALPNGRHAERGEPSLTGRERQIAELAATGFTARQIGDRLHIGVRTVETHLARVYRKLGVGSKQQLVSRRSELGLVANP